MSTLRLIFQFFWYFPQKKLTFVNQKPSGRKFSKTDRLTLNLHNERTSLPNPVPCIAVRRGYGVDYLDTTDPVWNVRLTYSHPRYTRWVFMADGFDLLHKLSNVNYAVTATGRTVTYTNSLPRYLMFSVQYRLNLQPKKH